MSVDRFLNAKAIEETLSHKRSERTQPLRTLTRGEPTLQEFKIWFMWLTFADIRKEFGPNQQKNISKSFH